MTTYYLLEAYVEASTRTFWYDVDYKFASAAEALHYVRNNFVVPVLKYRINKYSLETICEGALSEQSKRGLV